ncbi:MAG TPA: TIGR02646 family protein [Candidatus Avacidaminococcus intestinavium]|uniref:TIGR02646 family protein n=1 Tax=Candidatus Avacidaminococcus intestinavium TaxID=2840684 RepID=A0A9D1MQI3_9FIRM|nr:TIGR02646 family protein [Candidatus Avacidaminococcus intestinavium]
MKRVNKSRHVPETLKRYAQKHPKETWEHFRRQTRTGYQEVKAQIYKDQHGLCAYCEISIRFAEDEDDVDDFRIEHFYPKSETAPHGKNWHLNWQNMLGVCHGGSQKSVPDAKWRYSERKSDRSCDVPKGGRNLAAMILNPLKIPADKPIFRYVEHNGKMLVNKKSCPKQLLVKAENTIRELNLNAPRLRRMRMVVINVLQEEIESGLKIGLSFEECLERLAAGLLAPDEQGVYRSFFSVIRWYLGPFAERFLEYEDFKI